jgi:hypothetical protein
VHLRHIDLARDVIEREQRANAFCSSKRWPPAPDARMHLADGGTDPGLHEGTSGAEM